jgi:hypothetical protein
MFTEAGEPMEADHWIRAIESKFWLLHCIDHQKTLFTKEELLGDAGVWWANNTIAHPMDYPVSWAQFHNALHTHHISTGIMKRKHQEFMYLKQGRRSVHDYLKMLNHLAQYTLEQVDTDEKKKYHIMKGLSTKLQECLAINTNGTLPEFVSNAIITDDAIRAHNKGKKRKAMVALSGSAPPKYRMYNAPHSNPPPHPHQHQ